MILSWCTFAHAILHQTRGACLQILTALKVLITHETPGTQLALCSANPVAFRAQLQEHVITMAPLGFNANALGIMAMTHMMRLFGTDDLAAQFTMLRNFFHPWGDELADDIRLTKITAACLPAVVHSAVHVLEEAPAKADHGQISRLHKAVLAGTRSLMIFTWDGLEDTMCTLAAAGLCANEEDARRLSIQRISLLKSRTLGWFLERKAAVLEAGGDEYDVLAACCQNTSLQATLKRLLLHKRAGCAASFASAAAIAALHNLVPQVTLPTRNAALKGRPQRRGVLLTIRNVLSGSGHKLLKTYGANGVKGGKPPFEEYVASEAGQAELRAWQARISAQVQAELSWQLEKRTRGAFVVQLWSYSQFEYVLVLSALCQSGIIRTSMT